MYLLVDNKPERLYNGKMEKITNETTIRINKYLSSAGVCSRREADQYTDAGRITINGRPVSTGERVSPNAEICLDGKLIQPESRQVLLLFYKPRGIVCSTKKQRQETTVTEFLDYPVRIYPIGRLDKESEGLLLLTNQGDLVNRIMRAGNYHEKEYLVTVNKEVTPEFIRHMASGVPILDTITRKCFVEKTGKNAFRIILTQGLNRQIRRMCSYLGYEVVSLKRIRIMNLTLSGLKSGEYREIQPDEMKRLEQMLKNSSSKTITGGNYGNSPAANERAGQNIKQSGKSLLSGRSRDHGQSGVRRSVRSAGKTGEVNRNHTGRQPHSKRRL